MLSEPWATRVRKIADSAPFGETQLRLSLERLVAEALSQEPPALLALQEEAARQKAANEDLYATNVVLRGEIEELHRRLEYAGGAKGHLRKEP